MSGRCIASASSGWGEAATRPAWRLLGVPGEMPKIRWAFEAGLPDPATFPLDDLERLTDDVLRDDAADALQYGGPGATASAGATRACATGSPSARCSSRGARSTVAR